MRLQSFSSSSGLLWIRKGVSFLLLIIFYLSMGIVFAEISVRLTKAAPPVESLGWFWRSPDPLTGWQLEANTSGFRTNEFSEYFVSMSVNSRGLRGPETQIYAKPSDLRRILVLGDSFIEAAQVEWEESFPQRLAQIASGQSGQAVEAVNAGVRAWGNDQELIWLQEEGYKYDPDLIVVAMFPQNDFMNNTEALEVRSQGQILKPFFTLIDNQLQRKYWPFDPATIPPIQGLLPPVYWEPDRPGPLATLIPWLETNLALYRYVEPRLRIVSPRLSIALTHLGLLRPGVEMQERAFGDDYIPPVFQVYQSEWGPEWQGASQISEAIFAELQRTAQGMGAELAVVLIPAKEQIYPLYWEQMLLKYPALAIQRLDSRMPTIKAKEMLARLDIPTVDLLGPLKQASTERDDLYFVYDGHWTAQGTNVAAQTAYAQLTTLHLLPPPAPDAPLLSTKAGSGNLGEWILWTFLSLLVISVLWDIFRNGPVTWTRKVVAGFTTIGELLIYFTHKGHYLVLPMMIILLIFAGFLVLAQASVVGPFIYTLI